MAGAGKYPAALHLRGEAGTGANTRSGESVGCCSSQAHRSGEGPGRIQDRRLRLRTDLECRETVLRKRASARAREEARASFASDGRWSPHQWYPDGQQTREPRSNRVSFGSPEASPSSSRAQVERSHSATRRLGCSSYRWTPALHGRWVRKAEPRVRTLFCALVLASQSQRRYPHAPHRHWPLASASWQEAHGALDLPALPTRSSCVACGKTATSQMHRALR